MIVSRCFLCRSGLRLRVLGLDRRHDLRNPCKAFHTFKLLLAVQQHGSQPPLEHRAPSCTLDVPFALTDQREHALDWVGRQQRLAQQRGDLQPMHRQQLLKRLQEGVCRRLVLAPQPRLQLQQHLPGFGVVRLLHRDREPLMGFGAVPLRQVPLQIPGLMNGASLMHQLLAEPFPQRLAQAAPTVRDEEDSPREHQAATLQVSEQRLADLVIL